MPAITPPRREAELVPWLANFNTLVQANALQYTLPASFVTSLGTTTTAFMSAWNITQVPTTRTTPSINAKDIAKNNVLNVVRAIIGILQANTNITDAQRLALGMHVRDAEPTPVPAPAFAPNLIDVVVSGRLVSGRLQDSDEPTNRGRPAGVVGATIFSYVGANPSDVLGDWKFQGNTTRTRFEVQFPDELVAGTKVWLIAYWRSPTDESGPPCAAVSAILTGGVAQAA